MGLPLAVAAAVIVAVGGAAVAGADTTYSDPQGDVFATSPELAPLTPDLTSVAVFNTPDGRITFQIAIAGPEVLHPDSAFGLFLDIDKNAITGDDGDDAQAFFDASGSVDFERWNGSEMLDVPETNMSSSFANRVLTYTVHRSELDNTASFQFWVGAAVVTAAGFGADVAPDGLEPAYTYDLVALAAPSLSTTRPSGTPARPRAGKRFTVTSVVTRDDTGGPVSTGTVTCAVRVGKAPVRATGGFAAAGARCQMTVPRTAKGKLLRGTMTIRSEGATATRPFSFRVV